MNSFISIIREPDSVKIQYEDSPLRFEEECEQIEDRKLLSFKVENDTLKIYLLPTQRAVKKIKLRFCGDLGDILTVLGDSFGRTTGANIFWQSIVPQQQLPWYFHTFDGECVASYGVKTGANSFASWYCDSFGITLWLDVRNGLSGISLTDELLCAEVICDSGKDKTPYNAARAFCARMCEKPKLLKEPVYGLNNWYWAYGDISHESVIAEAEFLSRISKGNKVRPYMIIDDGWQINHASGYNGGPWDRSNELFPSMADTADKIHSLDCKAGLWIRPLLTMSHLPSDAIYPSAYAKCGIGLDPTHPFTREKVAGDISRISCEWGYDLIKHDFTTLELFGDKIEFTGEFGGQKHFYDKSKTNAQILKELYTLISDSAKNSVIIGCNTIGHLAAGIHEIQRVGGDTSGRVFEHTRRNGIHSMMRLPQNMNFFLVDPDCAVFTDKVSHALNFDFLEAQAISGTTTLASIVPDSLTAEEEKKLAEIFKLISENTPERYALCDDWHKTAVPSRFTFEGEKYSYDWYREHMGARVNCTWVE